MSVTPSMAGIGGGDSCPSCGAQMAADQRYCLNCGHRRGDPRLPFMDAVVFMESMNAPGGAAGATPPPPPAEQKSNRMNANAALIAGVATLVLAIGVGFLIGRSGHENSTQAAAPQVIKVEGGSGGGGEESATATASEESTTGGNGSESKANNGGKSGGKAPSKKKASEIKEGSKEEEERAQEAQQEILHSEGPEAKVGAQVGEKCEKGTPGCSNGEEFTGNFFGE
ncbi:MAG: zinc ribbon domain-containing protein [Solirubrobacterales bacterium]